MKLSSEAIGIERALLFWILFQHYIIMPWLTILLIGLLYVSTSISKIAVSSTAPVFPIRHFSLVVRTWWWPIIAISPILWANSSGMGVFSKTMIIIVVWTTSISIITILFTLSILITLVSLNWGVTSIFYRSCLDLLTSIKFNSEFSFVTFA